MNTKYSLLFFNILLLNLNIIAQSWPIHQADDPNHFYILSAEFGEIHPAVGTYPDHFHRAIDINIDGNVEVRPIIDGEVILIGESSVQVGSNEINDHWQRKVKYLHISPNVTMGQVVTENTTLLGYSTTGNNTHLHLEMRVWNGSQYVVVPLLNNNTGFQLTLPTGHEDTYPPQINDIIVEALNNQPNNVPSGYEVIDPNNNNGVVKYPVPDGPYRKVHIDDTQYGCTFSTGNEYDYPDEKLIVWGNIAFILNARDIGVNSPPGPGNSTPGGGEGLTVQHINYSIYDESLNEHLKYDVDFTEFYDVDAYNLFELFHHPYFDPGHYLYGNDDFIELRSTNNIYLHIHQLINGIQSNGIWFTKALNTTQHVFNQTPTEIAYVNDVAKYKDGEQTLNFYVSDAANQCFDYDLNVIVDNFPPYVKKLEIRKDYATTGDIKYSAYWNWDQNNNLLEFIPNNQSGTLDGSLDDDYYVTVWFSEPVNTSETFLSIPGLGINNLTNIGGNAEHTKLFFFIDGSVISSANPDYYEIHITCKDLANTELYGFTSTNGLSGANIPKRAADGNWQPSYSNHVDIIHGFTIVENSLVLDFNATNPNLPVGSSTTFNNTTTGSSTPWFKWEFEGGEPAEAFEGPTSPFTGSVTYNTAGEYDVTLYSTNEDFTQIYASLTKENYIKVGYVPDADFEASTLEANIDDPIVFSDLSTGNPTSWLWNFGDGNTSTMQNPMYNYDEGGVYTVSLTATNQYGSNTETKVDYITINDPRPGPDFNTSNGITNIEPDNYIDFEDESTNDPTSWFWIFEGGNPSTSTEQNPDNIYYSSLGAYDVSLTVSNEFGSRTITKDNFILVTNPAISLEVDCYPEFYTYTVGDEIKFTANVSNGTGPYTYNFSFNNENVYSISSPLMSYTAQQTVNNPYDTYFISVTVTDANDNSATCMESVTVQQIGASHNVDFSWSPSNPVLGQDITFINNTSGGSQPYLQSYWQWFKDPTTGLPDWAPHSEILWTSNALNNPPFTANYDEIGDYPVKLTVSDAQGFPASKTKIIHFVPADECIYFYNGDYGWPSIVMYPGEFASVDNPEFFNAEAGCCLSPDCDIQPTFLKNITNIRWKLLIYNGSEYVYVPNSEQYFFDEIGYPENCEDDIGCNCYWYSQGYGNGSSWILNNAEVEYTFSQKGDYCVQCEVWNPCYGNAFLNPNPYTYENLQPSMASQLPYYDVARYYFKVTDCYEELSFSIDIQGSDNPDVWGGYITLGGTSAHTIHSGAEITYVAHQEIILKDNFTAEYGCTFTARIEPCPDYSDISDDFINISKQKNNKCFLHSNSDAGNYFQVKIFPNPTTGKCKVSLPNLKESFSLLILDNLGNIVFEKNNIKLKITDIDLTGFSKGIYLLKIITEDKTYIKKIIKQ